VVATAISEPTSLGDSTRLDRNQPLPKLVKVERPIIEIVALLEVEEEVESVLLKVVERLTPRVRSPNFTIGLKEIKKVFETVKLLLPI
jgi:hypothetical protein